VRKLTTTIVSAVAAMAAAMAVPATAAAAPQDSTGADFAVSAPSEPLTGEPGQTVHAELTVANNGTQPLTVVLTPTAINALDDGKVEVLGRPDPLWSAGTTVTEKVSLEAGTYRKVPVSIQIPDTLLPDLYLTGIVAQAQPARPASVKVYHQIASLLTVQIPGPRERHMDVTVAETGFLHFGSAFTGAAKVRNVGATAAYARGQVQMGQAAGTSAAGIVQTSRDMQLYPAGTGRSLAYEYGVSGLFLLTRPEVQVLYSNGGNTMQQVSARGDLVLVIPWYTVALVVTILLAGLWWATRRRRKSRHVAA
jgi:hypothetical protein